MATTPDLTGIELTEEELSELQDWFESLDEEELF